jgi:hypothetical protein
MESWLVVFDRRNVIGTPDRDDQVCVGCVGVQAIGDKSAVLQCHLIALKQLARTGNFSSFADSRSSDGVFRRTLFRETGYTIITEQVRKFPFGA